MLAPAVFLLLWSGGYVVAKVGLRHSPPLTLLSLRYAVVVALMGILFAIVRPPLPKRAADWAHLAIVGLLIQVVYFAMCWMAFVHGVAAATVALLMSLQPILVAMIAPYWSRESVGARRWVGLLIALAGTTAVIVSRAEVSPPSIAGLAFAVAGLLGMTGGTLWEKRFGVAHHPVTANLIGYAAGLAGVLPLMLWFETATVQWNGEFVAALAYLVLANSLIAVGVLLAMIRAGAVSRVSALMFLVPPGAALLAWLVLDEAMPPMAWAGLAVAGGGVYLATRPG